MKTYVATFKFINRRGSHVFSVDKALRQEEIEAATFREARKLLRQKYGNTISNIELVLKQ